MHIQRHAYSPSPLNLTECSLLCDYDLFPLSCDLCFYSCGPLNGVQEVFPFVTTRVELSRHETLEKCNFMQICITLPAHIMCKIMHIIRSRTKSVIIVNKPDFNKVVFTFIVCLRC